MALRPERAFASWGVFSPHRPAAQMFHRHAAAQAMAALVGSGQVFALACGVCGSRIDGSDETVEVVTPEGGAIVHVHGCLDEEMVLA